MDTQELTQMAPNEARVLIARDVLKQVEVGMVVPYCGMYVQPEKWPDAPEETTPFYQLLLDSGGCRCCVIGALLVSVALQLRDPAFTQKDWRNEQRNEMLRRFFSHEQLMLVEYVFEGWDRLGLGQQPQEARQRWLDTAGARLRALMQNIIDNNGTFVPAALGEVCGA